MLATPIVIRKPISGVPLIAEISLAHAELESRMQDWRAEVETPTWARKCLLPEFW
jgi:hypothetical protein